MQRLANSVTNPKETTAGDVGVWYYHSVFVRR